MNIRVTILLVSCVTASSIFSVMPLSLQVLAQQNEMQGPRPLVTSNVTVAPNTTNGLLIPQSLSPVYSQPSNGLSQFPYQPTTPAVTILGHSYWFDNSNEYIGPILYIVGEAMNQSPSVVSGVKVIATLYDSNNKII